MLVQGDCIFVQAVVFPDLGTLMTLTDLDAAPSFPQGRDRLLQACKAPNSSETPSIEVSLLDLIVHYVSPAV